MPDRGDRSSATLQPLDLRPSEFAEIKRLAYDKFGLDLRSGKEELVSARLGKVIRKGGFRSFAEYYRHVVGDPSGEALIHLIDALTTNFTSFLREPAHFDFLKKEVVPGWRGRSEVHVWSAACSTGEEPYTVAFSLLDQLKGAGWPSMRILATDISTRALETARRGVYASERFGGVPESWLSHYLLRGKGRAEGWFKVKPEVQKLIEFQRLNLIEPLRITGPFALILCRNVMIYFDKPTQQQVVEKLASRLEPGGYLFVGHSESLTGRSAGLDYVRPAIYRKSAPGDAPARSARRIW